MTFSRSQSLNLLEPRFEPGLQNTRELWILTLHHKNPWIFKMLPIDTETAALTSPNPELLIKVIFLKKLHFKPPCCDSE